MSLWGIAIAYVALQNNTAGNNNIALGHEGAFFQYNWVQQCRSGGDSALHEQ